MAILRSLIKKQEAALAKAKASLAAAEAAKAAKAVAEAPAQAKPAALFVPKRPTLREPVAHHEHVVGSKGRTYNLYTARHKEDAAVHAGARDHASWTKYWDPVAKKFVSKERKLPAGKQYHVQMLSGEIQPPRGHYFNTATERIVAHDTVFTKNGKMKAAYAGLKLSKGLLVPRDDDEPTVTVPVIFYFPMEFTDEDGTVTPYTKAIFDQRKDRSLLHAVDPDGHYHEEHRRFFFNTNEAAVAPWLQGPDGGKWWVWRGAPYKSIGDIQGAPIGKARNSRRHYYDTLATALGAFFSEGSLSCVEFLAPVPMGDAPPLNTIEHQGKKRLVYSPHVDANVNAAATRLEDWIVDANSSAQLPTEGEQVVPLVLPEGTGCGYQFIISTFANGFETLKKRVDAAHPRGRYPDVHMTPRWLFENVFHVGYSYDANNLGLTLPQLRLFFEKFRVSLFVYDITGRLQEDACHLLWEKKDILADPSLDQEMDALNERLRPNSAHVIAHNEHLFPIDAEDVLKRLTQVAWNANSFLWRPIRGLGMGKSSVDHEPLEEAIDGEPSARYNLGTDDAPIVFLPNIDALASLNVRIQKVDKKGVPRVSVKGTPSSTSASASPCPRQCR